MSKDTGGIETRQQIGTEKEAETKCSNVRQ
jgi:hypothetical protein